MIVARIKSRSSTGAVTTAICVPTAPIPQPLPFEVRSNVKGINCDTSVTTAVLKTAVTSAVPGDA